MKPPWKQKRKNGVTAWSNVPVAGTRMDVSIRFPSSDLASWDKVHRWRPCPPACGKLLETECDTQTHTHTHKRTHAHGQTHAHTHTHTRASHLSDRASCPDFLVLRSQAVTWSYELCRAALCGVVGPLCQAVVPLCGGGWRFSSWVKWVMDGGPSNRNFTDLI